MAELISTCLGSFQHPAGDGLEFHELYTLADADWFPRQDRCPPRGPNSPRKCAFCLRGSLDGATFKRRAHIVPELFGSNSILTLEECDACNQTSGHTLEDALGKMLLQERVFGRLGRAKVSIGSGRSSVSSGTNGPLLIEQIEGDPSVAVAPLGPQEIKVSAPVQPYRPMDAIRSIAKMAYLLMPLDLRPGLSHIRPWIMRRTDFSNVAVSRIFLPGPRPFDTVGAAVWTLRPGVTASLPEFVTMFWAGAVAIALALPDLDGTSAELTVLPDIPQPPIPTLPPTLRNYRITNDEVVRPGASSWNMHVSEKMLRYSRTPLRVQISSKDNAGNFSLTSILRTPPENNSPGPEIRYAISGEAIGGTVTIERNTTVGGRFVYVPPPRDAESELARRFLVAVRHGTSFEIREVDPSAEILFVWPTLVPDAEPTKENDP